MVGRLLISLIKLYQLSLSPLLGNRCRFYPSCSCYSTSCLEAYPLHIALKKISLRLCKCQPWHPGGIDLP